MITDEDARKLVKDLRVIAAKNAAAREEHESEYWLGQSDGRTGAYSLAAGWLEEIIHEEADDVSDSGD